MAVSIGILMSSGSGSVLARFWLDRSPELVSAHSLPAPVPRIKHPFDPQPLDDERVFVL
jgi:hypothetical protein